MEVDLEEAIKCLEDGIDVVVLHEDGKRTIIGDAQNYIGAPDQDLVPMAFISEYLGNVYYTDAKHIIEKTVKELADNHGIKTVLWID